jgi:hypothetical protein
MLNENFKLPIMYCDGLHVLSKDVINDLELDDIFQRYILKSDNIFAKNMSKKWCSHITSNVEFLEDTQKVINNMNKFKKISKTDSSRICEVWNDTKRSETFMERYNYFDWHKSVLPLNESPIILQIFSTLGLFYPLISILIPVLTLLFAFIILKVKGTKITFDIFFNMICKHHFSTLTPDKLIYGIFYVGLYIFGVYSNVNASQIIYHNIQNVNKNLFDFKTFVTNSIEKMELFIELNKFVSYKYFCEDIQVHLINIKEFYNKIENITPFELSIKKVGDFGSLLSSYYELRNNTKYDLSFKFLLGFDGYLDNLSCLCHHIDSGVIANATYEESSKTSFTAKKQIYPPHSCLPDIITNDVNLKQNMIITGPNASGKTTYIKMTAINIILSQQIGCGYYEECSINPFTNIHSYINIPDTSERDSLFQAESRRCKNIIDAIDNSSPNSRHFCIFDELFTGTTSDSSSKASYSFLAYLCKNENVKFLLTTHYKNVCKKLHKKKNIRNYKMDVIETKDGLEYSYKITKGISNIDGAIHVLKELNYPHEIIQTFLSG